MVTMVTTVQFCNGINSLLLCEYNVRLWFSDYINAQFKFKWHIKYPVIEVYGSSVTATSHSR